MDSSYMAGVLALVVYGILRLREYLRDRSAIDNFFAAATEHLGGTRGSWRRRGLGARVRSNALASPAARFRTAP